MLLNCSFDIINVIVHKIFSYIRIIFVLQFEPPIQYIGQLHLWQTVSIKHRLKWELNSFTDSFRLTEHDLQTSYEVQILKTIWCEIFACSLIIVFCCLFKSVAKKMWQASVTSCFHHVYNKISGFHQANKGVTYMTTKDKKATISWSCYECVIQS